MPPLSGTVLHVRVVLVEQCARHRRRRLVSTGEAATVTADAVALPAMSSQVMTNRKNVGLFSIVQHFALGAPFTEYTAFSGPVATAHAKSSMNDEP
jgi:hypothetical protein